jgi:hypothetical protein
MDDYTTLDQLKAQQQALQAQGPALFDCWIAESKPGGTAINASRHFQLRSRKPQFNGKKSRYLRTADVGEYRAAIALGKEIKSLNKQITLLEQQF